MNRDGWLDDSLQNDESGKLIVTNSSFSSPILMKTQIALRNSSLTILTNRCGKFSLPFASPWTFSFAEMKRQKIYFSNSDSIITFRLSRRDTYSGFCVIGIGMSINLFVYIQLFAHCHVCNSNLISFQSTFCLNLTAQTWKHSSKNAWMETNCVRVRATRIA